MIKRDTHAMVDDHLSQAREAFPKRIFYKMKKVYHKDHLLFLLIVALSAFLRFYRFPSIPAGMNVDEADAGYEAYALLLYGTDRWGNPFPVYFPGFGPGHSALLSYLNIPFVRLFGLTIFAQRFSSGLLGVLTIVVLYAFVKKWYNTRTALITSFLLATNPWHIMMSRWALEGNLLPFFLLLGFTSLSYCYTSKYSRILICFSLLFLAVALYAYTVPIFIIPTFLVLFFPLVGLGTLWRNKLSVLLSFLIFFLVASPFFLFLVDNFILHRTPSIVQYLPFSAPLLISNRFEQVAAGQNALASNAQFLLSGFRDGLVWNMAADYSPLGLLSVPLAAVIGIYSSPLGLLSVPLAAVIGIYYSIKKRKIHANIFLLWIVSTIPMFLLLPLNINRANAVFIPLIALSAIGISSLYDSINTKHTKLVMLSFVLAVLTLYNGMFCMYYFNTYNKDIENSFNAGFDIALMQARSSTSAGELMYVSDQINQNYIYTLFYLKADPLDFQKHSRVVVSDGWYQVLSYRNYYFSPGETVLTSVPSFVAILKDNEQLSCGDRKVLYSEGDWTVERCFN